VPFLGTIVSPDNAKIKSVRSLENRKRARYREKRYLIEGSRLVAQALEQGCQPVLCFCTEAFISARQNQSLVQALIEGDTSVWQVSPSIMSSMSDTTTPQGIIAIAPMQEAEITLAMGATLLLVLDSIRDPGNLGTILRTALATGVEAVLLSKGCVDPYSPKVVRAGMGAHFALPIFPMQSWPDIARLVTGKRCLLADAQGVRTCWEVDWTVPSALFIGSEAHGAGPQAQELAQCTVRLPMAEGMESLNAAIAAAVFLFEAQHQRQGG